MKILFITTSLILGGAEKQVIDIADRFARSGSEVVIAYMTGDVEVSPISPFIRLVNLKVSKSIIGFSTGFFKLRSLIKEFQPEVVHSHMVHANIFARLVRLTLYFPKLICTAHSTNEGGKFRMLAYRLTDSLADLSTNVSDEAVAAFVAHGAVASGRMISVPNGIDINRFIKDRFAGELIRAQMGVDQDIRIILAVGRLTEAKDYPNLLNAYANLYKSNLRSQLWIVGEGKLRIELENLANTLGLSNCVQFLGVRHDVPSLMSAADVFVLSSAWEGFGIVVAEAMACECIVVATDSGGVSEVLGREGYLVPPKNSVELAHAIQLALQIPAAKRADLVSAARQRVMELYALDAVATKWLRIYKS